MNGDVEQKLKNLQEQIDKTYKEVKSIKRQLLWGNIIYILVIVVPILLLIYFLPKILTNFLGVYLPPGTNIQNLPQELKGLFQGQ